MSEDGHISSLTGQGARVMERKMTHIRSCVCVSFLRLWLAEIDHLELHRLSPVLSILAATPSYPLLSRYAHTWTAEQASCIQSF